MIEQCDRGTGPSSRAPRIWVQQQSPCPSMYWVWCIVVQGINDRFCEKGPSSSCTFNKNEN